jgi:hypothetical protein
VAADLPTKLLIKPDARVLVLNAPIGYLKKIAPLPTGATLTDKRGKEADVVLAFVRDSGELKRLAPSFPAFADDGILWVCYPKGGKAGTDLDRASLWAALARHELTGVTLVAIDDTWSAMRFRAAEDVGS